MNREKYNRALQKAMALCSRSEKCVKDIRDKLDSWDITDPGSIEKLISELKKEGFIDERRYAFAYAREKHRFNRWGKRKISLMLGSKGIERELVGEALEAIDPGEYRETLKNDLLKKRSSVKAVNQYDLKGKLIRFAAARGYENDLIWSVIDEVIDNKIR
ncbi:MAG: recombination regulator RecX [Bacteroidales bacterium]|nr:recombination regulator RecX [Bacteroidales bacterium]